MNVKRQRTENWSKGEIEALKASYLSKYDVIEGRLSPSLTNKDKEIAWREVYECVNCQESRRSIVQIKKKISDIKVGLRKKERIYREMVARTGGGPAPNPPNFDEFDSQILSLLPQSTISGFGGFDTFGEKVDQHTESEEIPVVETPVAETSAIEAPVAETLVVIGNNSSENKSSKSTKRKHCADTEIKEDYIKLEREKLNIMKDIQKSLQQQAKNTENIHLELKNLSGLLLGRDILNSLHTEW